MKKGVILWIVWLLPFAVSAQDMENDSLVHDSLASRVRPGAFKRVIKELFTLSDFDTTYVSPNRYNYALMIDHFTNYEYYSVSSSAPVPQRLRFSPNPHNKIGLYFGWQWIFLGWSVDIDDVYRKGNGKKRGTEFDLSLYSGKYGVDIFYRKTGNNYKIHKMSGFPEWIPSDYSSDFNGLNIDIKGLNLYYILNNRRFSYPAAFSQSTNQRRNAGSLIAGFSVSTHNLHFDYMQLPDIIRESMNDGLKVEHIKFTNISLNFGYGYNWVFARNCLACISLNPAIAYKTSRIEKVEPADNEWYKKFNVDFILRAGVVYNNSKYYVGTSFVGRTYDYYQGHFSLNNGFGTLQVYAGFNFHLKKQYRNKARK